MGFAEIARLAKLLGRGAPEDYPVNWCRCVRAVARGEMSVDEAWEKYQSGYRFPIDPFGIAAGEDRNQPPTTTTERKA